MQNPDQPTNAITLSDLAAACGVTRNTVYTWKCHHRLPDTLFRVGQKWWIPTADADAFIARHRERHRHLYGENTQPFPPHIRTVDFVWLAETLGTSVTRIYQLNHDGHLPATVRRVGKKYFLPHTDAEQFVQDYNAGNHGLGHSRHTPDRSTVSLAWLADEAGLTRPALNMALKTHPLPPTVFHRGLQQRLPRTDAETWLRHYNH